MKTKYILFILPLFFIACGGSISNPGMSVFKLKNDDYLQHVWLRVNEKGEVVNLAITDTLELPSRTQPLPLVNGYYTDGESYGIVYGWVPTNILIENANYMFEGDTWNFEVIDEEPFLEYYYSPEDETYYEFLGDSAKLNYIISTGQIDDYFDNLVD